MYAFGLLQIIFLPEACNAYLRAIKMTGHKIMGHIHEEETVRDYIYEK
jgi:hypothetical protein